MGFLVKYPIQKKYLTGPSLRRPKIPAAPIRFMVAHDTGNPGSTAANNVNYYERSRDEMESSAHTFIDDKEIIECIPLLTGRAEKAWHVLYDRPEDNRMYGDDANDCAGGVELCYGGKINIHEAYKRYVWYFAYCCWRFGLNPTHDITAHYILDPARKVDPNNALRLLGITFDQFIADVICEYEECLEEEAMREELEALKAAVKKLEEQNHMEPPEWAQKAVDAAVKAGIVDSDVPVRGSLDFYRMLVVLHRKKII